MTLFRLIPLLLALAAPVRAEIAIQPVTSPGGVTAWLVEDHALPFTALEIRFTGGTSLDRPGARGAVALMTALLEEGAGDLDAQGFAAARDDLAADLRFSTDQDSVAVSARLLSRNRDRAVDLLSAALTAPRFDAEAVERVRGQVLSQLRSEAEDPDAIAGQAFDALAFGDHPYGSNGLGTEASVSALARDDILAAQRAALARDRLFVAAVGDITAKELGPLLDRLFGDLPATGGPQPARAAWRARGGTAVTDFDTPQSVILFGQEGIRREDPDFFAAFLAMDILGGDRFTARLMTELREKRGLTYGVSSHLVWKDHAAYIFGDIATSNDEADLAIDLIRAEWARLAAEGVTAQELADAKAYLTGNFPLWFDGNQRIAEVLVDLQMQGLPIDDIRTRNARIEAVTLDDVNRVAAGLLRPDALQVVVVGARDGLGSSD